jgi:hypothetical protein
MECADALYHRDKGRSLILNGTLDRQIYAVPSSEVWILTSTPHLTGHKAVLSVWHTLQI